MNIISDPSILVESVYLARGEHLSKCFDFAFAAYLMVVTIVCALKTSASSAEKKTHKSTQKWSHMYFVYVYVRRRIVEKHKACDTYC